MEIDFEKPTLEKPHPIVEEGGSGTQKIWRFPNGYGASVVQFKLMGNLGYGSYTSNENEWELTVLKFKGKDIDSFELCYDTSITSDVIGHLTKTEVEEILLKISKLEWELWKKNKKRVTKIN